MRCADFGPTPGRHRKATIKSSRLDGFFMIRRPRARPRRRTAVSKYAGCLSFRYYARERAMTTSKRAS